MVVKISLDDYQVNNVRSECGCLKWIPFGSECVLSDGLLLSLNIPSLARQRCLPSWGPRRTPWFFCSFSKVWCGRLLKLCFLGFWNYNSV